MLEASVPDGEPGHLPSDPPPAAAPIDRAPQAPPSRPVLQVEVVWGDITAVEADLYAVGHYELVLPRNAELALDEMVSGPDAPKDALVLTNLTRRGVLRGSLGDVDFFPWAWSSGPDARGRIVAVAGMGHLGSFGSLELRRLARNLAWAAEALPDVHTVCTVLIGSGGDNLPLAAAVDGLMAGLVDAVGPDTRRGQIRCLKIAEKELGKARAIHRRLLALESRPDISRRLDLRIDPGGVVTGENGDVGHDYCMALTIAAAATAARRDAAEPGKLLDGLLELVSDPQGFRERARTTLRDLASVSEADISAIAARLSVRLDDEQRQGPATTRLSFTRDGGTIRAAALTDTAVLPERRFEIDRGLLEATANTMTDPDVARLPELSRFLARLVVPRDFRGLVERAPRLVVEVDRAMAKLPWEMLSDRVGASDELHPIALKIEVARQLRTTYSAPPSVARVPRWPLRALVIGDPGDPRAGDSLPGARHEALAVYRMLRAKGIEVTAMIGAPSVPRDGELQSFEPADRLEVLMQLMAGDYDLLHYAGHGDFDPDHPESTGWVFQGGLLTSRQIERVDLAPSLVVANACLSARTSEALAGGGRVGEGRTEADLLPGLADEFFRRGVRNYVGTAWEIHDRGAVEFTQAFYDALIPGAAPDRGPTPQAASVGAALHKARQALGTKEKQERYRALWAAYQHYGDPQHVVYQKR